MNNKGEYYTTNNTAGIIRIMAIFLFAVGIVGFILCMLGNIGFVNSLITGSVFIISGVFIYAISETLCILHDIRTNTEHIRDYIESEKKNDGKEN